MKEQYKAMDVLTAAKNTYECYGDERYAIQKANNFLNRCGAVLEKGPTQMIAKTVIDKVVYAALDASSERVFWSNLK